MSIWQFCYLFCWLVCFSVSNINIEVSNKSILFTVIIGIHGLFFSPEWNWNIARKKVHEVNNIEHVEKQSLLSFLLALDGWQDYKNKYSF